MPVSLRRVSLAAAMLGAILPPLAAQAQSQGEKTGLGGVAPPTAGQEGLFSTPGLLAGGLLAVAVGVVLAVSSNDSEAAVSTTTTTTAQ